MKNNKGMTLVEIIIAIALISIVLLFLFMLLVTVNDINSESEVNSTYLINKSLILKNIEEDLRESSSITIGKCDIVDLYTSYGDGTNYFTYKDNDPDREDVYKLKANECLQIEYDDETTARLGVYYYKNKNSYVISYIHGNVKATRTLPEFEKYNVEKDFTSGNGVIKNNLKMNVTLSNSYKNVKYDDLESTSHDGFTTITIPIIGSDEKDYSIIISYYGIVTVES